MKGCALRCQWCHNPESQSPEVQKLYTVSKCVGAKDCIEICPNNALTMTTEGIATDYELCQLCGKCADACPAKAIEMSGKMYSITDLLEIIERERVHIDQSGGGVTFSGGEPLMHPEFLIEMLKACGDRGFHRTVDTCGFAPTGTLLEVAKHTDLFLYDLKMMDPEQHKKWTGVDNVRILKNLKILAEAGSNINIRIPFIRNVNTQEEEIIKMAQFIASLPWKTNDSEIAIHRKRPLVNILPYHDIARGKYDKLHMEYNHELMQEPTQDELNNVIDIFSKYGLEAEIGG